MKRLDYSRQSQIDFADIAEYIADVTGEVRLGRNFVAQLKRKCVRIATLPGTLGRLRDELAPNLRSIAYKDYLIFFRYAENGVEIATIIHGQRDIEAIFHGGPGNAGHE